MHSLLDSAYSHALMVSASFTVPLFLSSLPFLPSTCLGRQPVSVSCCWTFILPQWWLRQGTGILICPLFKYQILFCQWYILYHHLCAEHFVLRAHIFNLLICTLVRSTFSLVRWLLGSQTHTFHLHPLKWVTPLLQEKLSTSMEPLTLSSTFTTSWLHSLLLSHESTGCYWRFSHLGWWWLD